MIFRYETLLRTYSEHNRQDMDCIIIAEEIRKSKFEKISQCVELLNIILQCFYFFYVSQVEHVTIEKKVTKVDITIKPGG